MICAECDRLDDKQIHIRNDRANRRRQRTLTPEIEARLESEERMVLEERQNHRINDHQMGGSYE